MKQKNGRCFIGLHFAQKFLFFHIALSIQEGSRTDVMHTP